MSKKSDIKISKLEGSIVELTFDVPWTEFEQFIQEAYLKKSKKISVPGFRKGKVPRKMIETYYGENFFYEDAMNAMFPPKYDEAVIEHKLSPIGNPEVEIVTLEKDKNFVFKIKTAVEPEVKLSEYKGVECKKIEYVLDKKFKDKYINDSLKELQLQSARVITVDKTEHEKSDHLIEKGDIAILDYSGFMNGNKFEGGSAENYELEIGSSTFIEGFEDKLIGHKFGDEFSFEIKFPESYFNKDLAGKMTKFDVKIKGIKFKELSPIDDEFAKDVSESSTLDELKKKIEESLKNDISERTNAEFSDAVVQMVVDKTEIDMPEVLIKEEFKNIVREFDERLKSRGFSVDYYLQAKQMSMQDFYEQQRANAEKRVKLRLTLNAVALKEEVNPNDEMIEKEYANLAAMFGINVEQAKKIFTPDVVKKSIYVTEGAKIITDNAVATETEKKNMSDDAKTEEHEEPVN